MSLWTGVIRATLLFLAILVCLSSFNAQAAPTLSNYRLVFSDEFNGTTLDPDKWNTGLLWGPYLPINNEEQLYVDTLGMHKGTGNDPFVFTGNSLKIIATPTGGSVQPPARPAETAAVWSDYPEYRFNGPDAQTGTAGYDEKDINYLSGIITSYDAFRMTHGYVEARMKIPPGQGLWPAFWLNPSFYIQDVPEIDIMEFLGHDKTEIYHTYHYFQPSNNWKRISTPSYVTKGDDFTAGWHTYGLQWGPHDIVWYVDGVEAKRITSDEYKIANQAMYIIANLAVGGNWPGAPDATTTFPAKFEIDYIRAYERDLPTKITPSVLSQQFELMFSDDFNGSSLNSNKWNTSHLWGPYLPINNEKQIYPDMLGEHQGYDVNPFKVSGGNLSITAQAVNENQLPEAPGINSTQFTNNLEWRYDPSYRNAEAANPTIPDYVSGVLTSYDAFKFVNGYAEIRAKLPAGSGLWPAFWLLNGYYVGQIPEIDIMEFRGGNPNDIVHSYHYYNNVGEKISNSSDTAGATDYTKGFHTYGVHWQKDRIDWYIDGNITHTVTGSAVASQVMYVILNLAVGGDFVGEVDEAALPAEFLIDYVRVWQAKLPFEEGQTTGTTTGSGADTSEPGDNAGSADGGSTTAGSDTGSIDNSTSSPSLTSPQTGKEITGSTATLRWSTGGKAVDVWQLQIGTAAGEAEYFDSGPINNTNQSSISVEGLPENGSTLVATLLYKEAASDWAQVTTSFISVAKPVTSSGRAIGNPVVAGTGLLSPATDTALPGSTATFTWETDITNLTQFWVRIGSTAGSFDHYDSGRIFDVSTRSITATNLPTDGSTVHFTFLYKTPTAPWGRIKYEYTAASAGSGSTGGTTSSTTSGTSTGGATAGSTTGVESGTGSTTTAGSSTTGDGSSSGTTTGTNNGTTNGGSTTAGTTTGSSAAGTAMVSPAANATLPGSTATFTWQTDITNLRQFWIRIGSSRGATDYYDSGRIFDVSRRSVTVSNLPTDGSTVYVRFLYKTPTAPWGDLNYTYTAASSAGGATGATAGGATDNTTGIDTTSGTTSAGSTTSASTTGGSTTSGSTTAGTTAGTTTTGSSAGSTTSGSDTGGDTTTGGSTSGSTGATTGSSVTGTGMVSPAAGATLPGSTATFTWQTDITNLRQFWIRIGSSVGATDYYDTGRIFDVSRRSVTATDLPTDGSTVYVRFLYKTPTAPWGDIVYSYNAASSGGGSTGTTTAANTPSIETTTSTTGSGTITGTGMVSPTAGSTLPGGTATFAWQTDLTNITQFWVRVGSRFGASDYYNSGRIFNTSQRSVTVNNLPTDGSKVYVQFLYKTPTAPWGRESYTYQASR